ncbi:MAG: molybdopterin-dependent oxidoreductase [Stigonema ocellatum SAG 48.90 = DSM 106950]|nr:molybdopterin-dependent oxidoreductase [Stigonema ocellatum SAG 48.90 = DSM 106950]
MNLTLTVNGEQHTLTIEPRVTLLDALREYLTLVGTKKGCDHGQCGACTVLIDGKLIGWGMAASSFPALRSAASVTVRLLADGTAHILTSGNDMGTGAYTIVAGAAAEVLGLLVEQIRVEMGDSLLPNGGIAGGSQMTATLIPAVMTACEEVLKIAKATTAPEAFATLRESPKSVFEATASSSPGEEGKKWAFQSWGALSWECFSTPYTVTRRKINKGAKFISTPLADPSESNSSHPVRGSAGNWGEENWTCDRTS